MAMEKDAREFEEGGGSATFGRPCEPVALLILPKLRASKRPTDVDRFARLGSARLGLAWLDNDPTSLPASKPATQLLSQLAYNAAG